MLSVLLPLAHAQVAPPVVNGQPTSDYPAVGTLIGCGSSCFSYCSATLVHQRWLITAAHCIEALEDYERYGYTMWFGVGPRLGELTDSVQTDASYAHPQYNSYTLNHDIGLVHLAEALTSVEPMPVNEDAVTNDWRGEELVYVGYGVTSDNANDGGVKRFAEMPLSQYDSTFVYTLDVSDGQNICYGDSGGASLREVDDGVYELVGANSHVFGHSYAGYMCEGGGSGAARVDAHLDWIHGYVEVGGYEPAEEDDAPGVEEEDDTGWGGEADPGPESGGIEAGADPIIVAAGSVGSTVIEVTGAANFTLTVLTPPATGIVLLGEGGVVEFAATEQVGEDAFTLLVETNKGTAEVAVFVAITEAEQAAGCATVPGSSGLLGLLMVLVAAALRRTDHQIK